jgi:hypothetical protein
MSQFNVFEEHFVTKISYFLNQHQILNVKIPNITLFKGTVARDFWPLVFIMNQPHMGP